MESAPKCLTAYESYGEVLEGIIDEHSVEEVLYVVARILAEKARCIQENWTDTPFGGNEFDKAAEEVSRCARSVGKREGI